MSKSILTTFFILFSSFLVAQEVVSSNISFTIKNAGIKVVGSFQLESATIQFNPNDLKSSFITASVNVNTIDTGIGLRDKHLKKEDYFDVENHPLIELTSKAFKKVGANQFEGIFNLTIRGITKEVNIPFLIAQKEGLTEYNATFEINRLDFNVGSSSWVMGDEVLSSVTIVTNNIN